MGLLEFVPFRASTPRLNMASLWRVRELQHRLEALSRPSMSPASAYAWPD